jgi:hypothetical protein
MSVTCAAKASSRGKWATTTPAWSFNCYMGNPIPVGYATNLATLTARSTSHPLSINHVRYADTWGLRAPVLESHCTCHKSALRTFLPLTRQPVIRNSADNEGRPHYPQAQVVVRLPGTLPRRNANIRRQVAPVVAQALADVDLHLAKWHALALSGKQPPETLPRHCKRLGGSGPGGSIGRQYGISPVKTSPLILIEIIFSKRENAMNPPFPFIGTSRAGGH